MSIENPLPDVTAPSAETSGLIPGHTTVVAVVIEWRGKIALFKRSQHLHHDRGLWHCVTGYLEPGVTPKQQALDELLEETGIHPTNLLDLRAGPDLALIRRSASGLGWFPGLGVVLGFWHGLSSGLAAGGVPRRVPGRAVLRLVVGFLCALSWHVHGREQAFPGGLPGPFIGQVEPYSSGAGGGPCRDVDQLGPDRAGPGSGEQALGEDPGGAGEVVGHDRGNQPGGVRPDMP